MWCAMLNRSRKKPRFAMWIPRSFGIWSNTITRPIPALKPVSTGAEMKLATNPRRITLASSRIVPTRAVNVAVAVISVPGSLSGTTRASCVPVRMARVVVELTLSTRDEPSSA
jgi:hypothetical protein